MQQAECIRDTYKEGGITYKELGKKYGIEESVVGKIVRRVSYTVI